MTFPFRPGVQPNDPSKPRLHLGPRLTGTVTPPPSANWDRAVRSWPMDANDQYGDCVFAMVGHTIQTWTANASTEVVPAVSDLLAAYSAVTGFNPADPATDQGTNMQDAFGYWRKTGIAGHKILAFAQVDHRSIRQLEAAAALFGEVLLAVSFPSSAMDQFDAGQPWDVVKGAQIEGGHAICSARYDSASKTPWTVVTWGREQSVTQAFFDEYLEEAWVAVSPEWFAANGSSPSGLDLHGLGEDFAALTGQPNPFPPGPPEPPPRSDALVAAARALAVDQGVVAWSAAHHSGQAKRVAALVQAVIKAAA